MNIFLKSYPNVKLVILKKSASSIYKSDTYCQFISDTSKDDEVGINNTVQVYIEEDDETETYKLVTTVRGNSLKGYVSIDSPLGKAILGHKVGDRVTVKVSDAYSYDLIIKSIENTADTDDELRSY